MIQEAQDPSQDINARIGNRVKTLRSAHGISLDALAAKCDVSRSMLSLVERGESSPTAVVLEKIATGLGVSLASLFNDSDTAPNPVSHSGDRTTWRDPQSGYVRRNISPATYPSPIQIVEVMLPADAQVSYETGAREPTIHQQIWVQSGTVRVTVDGMTYTLFDDDCLAMQLNVPITFYNPTDEPARYIVVVSTESSRPPRR